MHLPTFHARQFRKPMWLRRIQDCAGRCEHVFLGKIWHWLKVWKRMGWCVLGSYGSLRGVATQITSCTEGVAGVVDTCKRDSMVFEDGAAAAEPTDPVLGKLSFWPSHILTRKNTTDHHFPHGTGHILVLDDVRSTIFGTILAIFPSASTQIGISFVVLHYQSIFIGVMRCLFQVRDSEPIPWWYWVGSRIVGSIQRMVSWV